MAYFLPVGGVRRELLRARKRGVLVRLVVPGHSDVPLVQWASRHLLGVLLRRRFHIYERQLNMLHSKVMVVDGEWSLLGSCNMDARSLWINHELLVVVRSRPLAARLEEIAAFEMARSRRLSARGGRGRSWWRGLGGRLGWSVGWWLWRPQKSSTPRAFPPPFFLGRSEGRDMAGLTKALGHLRRLLPLPQE